MTKKEVLSKCEWEHMFPCWRVDCDKCPYLKKDCPVANTDDMVLPNEFLRKEYKRFKIAEILK